jgi:transcriptional regulator with XRE-family HTH domain
VSHFWGQVQSARGLTQKTLARETALSVPYVCQIEKNLKDPPVSTLEGIAKALGVPLSLLLFLASDPSELDGISQDLHEKMSSSVVHLLRGLRDARA